MPDLFETRLQYKPFEYPQAYAYWERQQQSHWLKSEFPIERDISDWKSGRLTDSEKHLIQHILKMFTQAEVIIEDYWARMVSKWFKKPEIQAMAHVFASFETIHADSYSLLDESLGNNDNTGFLTEPTARAKIDRLIAPKGTSKGEIARSLAVFSAFNEGVSLFSSFAILQHFSRLGVRKGSPEGLLKAVGQIIAASIKDESLHSEAGCWLFRTLVAEHPRVLTPELRAELLEAARLTIELEDNFLAQAFALGPIEGLTLDDMKVFIRHRCNTKLKDLGLPPLWTDLDPGALTRMSWFDELNGKQHADFFAARSVDYAKSAVDWTKMWEGVPV